VGVLITAYKRCSADVLEPIRRHVVIQVRARKLGVRVNPPKFIERRSLGVHDVAQATSGGSGRWFRGLGIEVEPESRSDT